ncbi:MAG: hypothetical protein CMJ78_03505 [Planctomycetaceae bacterium]|nr:hypothetical protein [Planctomycetaceae bacterium]
MSQPPFYKYLTIREASYGGIHDKWDITTLSVAKCGTTIDDDNPLLVANEWYCPEKVDSGTVEVVG